MEEFEIELEEINMFDMNFDEMDIINVEDDREVIVSGVDMNTPTNYEKAVNKPKINGVELVGDKTTEDLGIQSNLQAGDNIEIKDNVISVLTAPNVEQDNTKPITSAAVYTEVGNINILLQTI